MAKTGTNNLIENLLSIIEENNLNQTTFANMINVNQSQVSDWLSGKSKPSYDSIIDICRIFHVSADKLLGIEPSDENVYKFNIRNRRYTGSKAKLTDWIKGLILGNCKNCHSFCDIFAGTGVVTDSLFDSFDKFILNDFLFSNEVVYKAFFMQEDFDEDKLINFKKRYSSLNPNKISDNYVSINFGNKYFEYTDAKLIGYIREDIEANKDKLDEREYDILLASLLYSLDKCANTVGHYEAYFKGQQLRPSFQFNLIKPYRTDSSKKVINIYRQDANELAPEIYSEIVYIDPPYSSRQYSRFYHVLETITKWDKPKLSGDAMKPPLENMSAYCSSSAKDAFADLISKLSCKYIVVSYNNTYNSNSNSSANKISLEDINDILSKRGKTQCYEMPFKAFNAGKTNISDHKELIFITKVDDIKNKKSTNGIHRSPFFYVGDKYKLMNQLLDYFPTDINTYYEPFCGGGSSFLNVKAKKYVLNDIDSYVINLHKTLCSYSNCSNDFLSQVEDVENKYGLSASYRQDIIPTDLKKKYVKTYFAKFNKSGFDQMKKDFNKNKTNFTLFYVLLIYGFDRMLRFNSNGDFNVPVGNVDLNQNVIDALNYYFDFAANHKLSFYNQDFRVFLKSQNFKEGDFVYLDPPYLISNSEYNKLWGETDEIDLLSLLDSLNDKGVKFGISNLIQDSGLTNTIFLEWAKKYNIHEIDSYYINYHNNSKKNHREVFVTNY